jgi:hypothetical protein
VSITPEAKIMSRHGKTFKASHPLTLEVDLYGKINTATVSKKK